MSIPQRTGSSYSIIQRINRWSRGPRGTLRFAALSVAAAAIAFALHGRRRDASGLDGGPDIVVAALEADIRRTPAAERVPRLIELAGSPNPSLRWACLDELMLVRPPGTADLLDRAFRDSSSMVRERAMELMPRVDAARGYRLQLAALMDSDLWVRSSAATELEDDAVRRHPNYIDLRSVTFLIRAANDRSVAVSTIAMGVLRRLTGKPWKVSSLAPLAAQKAVVRRWNQWWAAEQSHVSGDRAFADVAPIVPTRADPAPYYRLRDLSGGTIDTDTQRGRITLINFWGTWCRACSSETAVLSRLQTDTRGYGVDIVGAATSETSGKDGVRRYSALHGLQYRQTMATADLQLDFGDVRDIPVSILIDRHGRIRYRWDGERDYDTFRAAVERLAAEEPR